MTSGDGMRPPINEDPDLQIGRRVPRNEDRRLLMGCGRYVDDISVQGMLHAAFLRSPYARARITGIDAAAARALDGVYRVFTGADLNRHVVSMRGSAFPPSMPYPETLPLAESDVRFAGDPIALVIASDRYIAEDAVELIEVDYEAEEPVLDYLTASEGRPVHPNLDTNLVLEASSQPDPELDEIFATAPLVVEEQVLQQRQANVPMETRGLIAEPLSDGDVQIWLSTQAPHRAGRYIAMVLGLAENQVRVLSGDVGGGFGMKVQPGRDEVAVVIAARLIGKPVKWIEDRLENLTSASHAREESATVKLAFDDDGRLLAAHFDYVGNSGAYPWLPSLGTMAADTFPGPYRIPRYGYRVRSYYTNTCGLGAYRGPWMLETLARETVMDIAARRGGYDPLELRRKNVIAARDLPYQTATGRTYDKVSPEHTLENVAALLDIPAFRAIQTAARAKGRYLGLGIGLCMEPTVHATAERSSTIAEVRIDTSGQVSVAAATHSAGHSTETTLAQIAAEAFGIEPKAVRVLQGDTSRMAFGGSAMGSGQAVLGGGAVLTASRTLREKVLLIAAYLLDTAPENLILRSGRVILPATEQSVSLKDIAEVAYLNPRSLPPHIEPGLEAQFRHAPADPIVWSNAAHGCTVEVDITTGLVQIGRWVVSADCGVMINPTVVEGQIAGGVAQGIGGVLLEHARYDAEGNPIAATFKDYLLPSVAVMPRIEFSHVCTPSSMPGGFKGSGEGGAITAPPTLVNAIADALSPFSVACTTLPLSPNHIYELLAGRTP